MKRTERVRTKRLTICPLTDEELRAKRDGENDPEMKKAYSEMLEGCIAHPDERIWYTEWCIRQKDGTPVGGICFKGTEQLYEVEIGYGIDEAYRGNGYASEAVGAMVNWAFSQSEKLYYVMAEVGDGNEGSLNVLKKNGFVATARGEEGMRYERVRESVSMIGMFMCFGLSIGMSFGAAVFHNPAIGMCFGLALGVPAGALLDSYRAKSRSEAETAHRKHYGLIE